MDIFCQLILFCYLIEKIHCRWNRSIDRKVFSCLKKSELQITIVKFLRTTVLTNFEASITITLLDTKLNLGKVADHTTINAQPHTRLISVHKPSNWKTMAHSIGNFPIWITMHGMRKWYNSMHFWLYQILGMIYLLTIFRKLRKKNK